jgi:hypothetical protein
MARKYSSEDFFSGSLFGKAIEEAKEFLGVLKDTIAVIREYGKATNKQIIETNEQTSEGIEETNKQYKDLTKTVETYNKTQQDQIKLERELTTLEKEQIKLQDRLAEGATEQAQANEILKVQIQQQNKLRKEQAKDSQGLTSIYQKESKRLRELKNDYKNLFLEGKGGEKATKELRREIIELDESLKDLDKSVGDNFREVGNYKKAIDELNDRIDNLNQTVKGATIIFLLTKIAEVSTDFFGSSREASLETQKAIANFTETVKVFASSTIQAFFGLKDVVVGVWGIISNSVSNAINSIQISITNLSLNANKALAFLGSEGAAKNVNELTKELNDLESQTYDNTEANEQLTKGLEAITAAYNGDIKAVSDAIDIRKELLQVQQDIEIQNLRLQRSLVGLTAQQEKLSVITDDDTRSFQERVNASQDLLIANQNVANVQEQIAANELRISRLRVASDLVVAGVIDRNEALALSDKQLANILREKDNALKVSSENEQEYTDAFIAYQDARNQSQLTGLETEQQLRKLESDRIEKNLDILIDGADSQKSINERIISDERISLERRQQLINQTSLIIETSYEKQKAAIIEFGTEQIRTNSLISEEERKRQLEVLKGADLDELVREKDATALNEKIRQLGLSEIFEGRLLEVIRERRTATLDLAETQRDFNDTQRESDEIVRDIIAQEEELEKLRGIETQEELLRSQEEFDKKRQENRLKAIQEEQDEIQRIREENIRLLEEEQETASEERQKQIDDEIEALEDASKRELELNQEKNDILLDQEREAAEKRLEEKEKEAEENEELQKNLIEYLRNQSNLYYDEQLDRIDEQIDASKERESQLIEASEAGVQSSSESIAFERQQQAELEQERQRVEQEKARAELLLTYLELIQANDGDIGAATTQLIGAQAFAKSFPLFKEGTENTGIGGGLDPDGGFFAVLHRGERVMTEEQNQMVGSLSNDELANVAYMYNTGALEAPIVNHVSTTFNPNQIVKAIEDLPSNMPIKDFDYDPFNKVLIETIKQSGRKTRNFHRVNRKF